jgi:hypothetical protein
MSHIEGDPEVVNAGTKPEMGWEMRDSEQYLGPIVKISLWFFAISIVFIVISIPIMNMAGKRGVSMSLAPLVDRRVPAIPKDPNPLIQSAARTMPDIYEHHKAQEHAANSYGWTDEKKGVAHVPIEIALERIASEGLPGGTVSP